jgi:hypothetical protein
VTVSQLALLPAAQPHPSAVRTSKVPDPPLAGADVEEDERTNVHPCPWLTVNVRPAIVSVPERPGPVVAAALNVKLPFPVALAADVIVSHAAWLVAVQAHPAPALTATEPLPPDGAMFCESGDIVNAHPSPWEIVTVLPATVAVPDRDGPLVGAAVKVTDPDPLPLAPPAIEIHESWLDAVHPQPSAPVTSTLTVPPPAPMV